MIRRLKRDVRKREEAEVEVRDMHEQVLRSEHLATLGEMGASVALNIVDTDTLASVGAGAGITGANDVNMSATSKNDSDTTAEGGSEGGTAVTPVVAIALMFDNTAAEIRTSGLTGGLLTISGALSAAAKHEGDVV